MTQDQIHQVTVAGYCGALLEEVIADLSRFNLRNYRDHETRWKAERLSAAKKELKSRNHATPTSK